MLTPFPGQGSDYASTLARPVTDNSRKGGSQSSRTVTGRGGVLKPPPLAPPGHAHFVRSRMPPLRNNHLSSFHPSLAAAPAPHAYGRNPHLAPVSNLSRRP
ncbi:hypothetical protein [Synechococcus sp. PCC 6312]|uniref:hypothetical protein n=1 Tax=Synechococcus sp. (strain ATCC 27167 / PCC 6312) TaxID=195253 RepID=UPI0012E9966E|nr:hypothetical protein [Synechococcus sp. PCC 6312]